MVDPDSVKAAVEAALAEVEAIKMADMAAEILKSHHLQDPVDGREESDSVIMIGNIRSMSVTTICRNEEV